MLEDARRWRVGTGAGADRVARRAPPAARRSRACSLARNRLPCVTHGPYPEQARSRHASTCRLNYINQPPIEARSGRSEVGGPRGRPEGPARGRAPTGGPGVPTPHHHRHSEHPRHRHSRRLRLTATSTHGVTGEVVSGAGAAGRARARAAGAPARPDSPRTTSNVQRGVNPNEAEAISVETMLTMHRYMNMCLILEQCDPKARSRSRD
ncbi:hypothetical protein EVAR_36929_1 [Eumeta japonica]|uniref:Uncharacterized protein n=1 Tax=Eumeta variegata TaxID=151549 RepID=A0A4C1X897_EUMVA|nr:hypothetical protein EVAR_36929_1 [Eumeta japonica]